MVRQTDWTATAIRLTVTTVKIIMTGLRGIVGIMTITVRISKAVRLITAILSAAIAAEGASAAAVLSAVAAVVPAAVDSGVEDEVRGI